LDVGAPLSAGRKAATIASCSGCGAVAHLPGARFCGHCGARLDADVAELPEWQKPKPAKYSHVVMSRIALSCPECGEPMRFGFRKVCRRCGARLVMVPRLLHPNHFRVYVAGLRAALAGLAVEVFWCGGRSRSAGADRWCAQVR
jgi:predicted amidophosphoribosyltransferase